MKNKIILIVLGVFTLSIMYLVHGLSVLSGSTHFGPLDFTDCIVYTLKGVTLSIAGFSALFFGVTWNLHEGRFVEPRLMKGKRWISLFKFFLSPVGMLFFGIFWLFSGIGYMLDNKWGFEGITPKMILFYELLFAVVCLLVTIRKVFVTVAEGKVITAGSKLYYPGEKLTLSMLKGENYVAFSEKFEITSEIDEVKFSDYKGKISFHTGVCININRLKETNPSEFNIQNLRQKIGSKILEDLKELSSQSLGEFVGIGKIVDEKIDGIPVVYEFPKGNLSIGST